MLKVINILRLSGRCLNIFLLFLLLWPFCASIAGAIRFHGALALSYSVSAALFIALAFFLYFYTELQKLTLNNKQLIACLCLFAACVYRLYNPDLGLLINYGCADAANHLNLYRQFVESNPQSYQGFNALYVSWYVFEKLLRLDLNFSLYINLLFPILTICYLVSSQIRSFKLSIFLPVLATTLIVFELVLLPIIHYNQADGYLAHLFSVSTIVPTIIIGANFNIFILAGLLVACRFSYGLQLPELLVAFGIFSAFKALKQTGIINKLLLISLSILSILATYFSISKLFEVFSASGSITSQNLDYAFASQIIAIALLIQLIFKADSKQKDVLIFLGLFFIACCCLQSMWLLTTGEAQYYFSKLFLYSSVIIAIMSVPLITDAIRDKSIYLSTCLILILPFNIVAQRPYLDSYYERVQPSGEYRLIAPLVDSKVKKIVTQVLTENNAKFAGYFTSRWGQFSYFNALYFTASDFETFKNPPADIPSKSCIFWSKNSNDLPRLERYGAFSAVTWFNQMNNRSDIKEVKYNSPWAGRQVIRYLCKR